MTPRSLQGVVALSVVLGTVAGLSACGGGGKTSSPTAAASAPVPVALAVVGPAAEAAATPPQTGGRLPAELAGVVGSGPFIVVDQFGYLPGLKKVAVLRDPAQGFDSADQYRPGARL